MILLIYYLTTSLFIIEVFNIVSTLYECMSQKSELKPCIEVVKSKWLDYYANIPVIYLLGLIFDPRCKLFSLFICFFFHYVMNILNFMVQNLTLIFNKMCLKVNLH